MDGYRVARMRRWSLGPKGGVALELDGGAAEVCIAEDGSVRLRAEAGPALSADPSAAIGREPWSPARAEVHAAEGGGVRLVADGPRGGARVEIVAEPFGVRVFDREGDAVAEVDDLAFARNGAARVRLAARPGERFFGFGEKPGGLDQRGKRLLMRNRDAELQMRDPLYVSIPFFMGLHHGATARARGVLLDAFAPSRFDVAASDASRVGLESVAGGIDLSVFPGPEPRDVVRRFTARVGRTPLPPLWALGHHQSRWSYGREQEVRDVAAELRARRIPTDVIHLDIDYMRGFRVFTWHPERFPNPAQLLSDLAEQGFRVVTIVDPGVKMDPDYAVYRDGIERDVFCRRRDGSLPQIMVWPKQAALPDFNRAEVRAWWGEWHRVLLDAGVAGIWNDMNEPAGWSREVRAGRLIVPLRKQDLSDVVQSHPADEARRVPHEHVRNLYGQQECRATRAFLESQDPERRPFVVSRSGHAGIQRYAAIWTGDNHSRWSHLRQSLPMLLNLSLSGVAFCGADIGGFAFSCTPELYARWIQIGALYPFARTHSMWLKRRQEPWRFGRRVEAIAREALELRMRLLPYLYGLFRESEQSGAPVWRPLFFEFPDDPEAATVQDQVMVGPALLAAPVLERGARERELYLPPGVWLSWHDDTRFVGPRRVRVPAPLERMPLFARAGALVPTRSPVLHAGEAPEEPFVLEVFPGADGSAELVEDDGESTAYRNGAIARTSLRLWNRAGGRLRVELGKREGAFPIAPRPGRIVVRACPPPSAVFLNGARVAPGQVAPGYTAERGRVQLRFADGGNGLAAEIDPAP
ncbi:MAG: TIM-barrel domain-containing protein [Myxococcota bacterium]